MYTISEINEINYWMPIRYETPSISQKIQYLIDCYWTGWTYETTKVTVISSKIVQNYPKATFKEEKPIWWQTALKVASLFTVVIPLCMLGAKFLLRKSPFYVIFPPENRSVYDKKLIDFLVSLKIDPHSPLHQINNAENISKILRFIKKEKIPIEQKILKDLCHQWVGKGHTEITKTLCVIDSNLFQQSTLEDSFLIKAALAGYREEALILQSLMPHQFLSTEEAIVCSILQNRQDNDIDLSNVDSTLFPTLFQVAFNSMCDRALEILSQKILESHQKATASQEKVTAVISEEKIDPEARDTDEKSCKEILLEETLVLFAKLYKEKRIILKQNLHENEKFYNYSENTQYLTDEDLDRIRYADLINEKAKDLSLRFVKSPKMKLVIDKKLSISVTTSMYNENLPLLRIKGVLLYSEFIESKKRFLSQQEFQEFITMLETVGYHDFWVGNYIIGKEATYIVDTEKENFGEPRAYLEKASGWEMLVSEENRNWAISYLQEKRNTSYQLSK